jgi:hypothetical protein
MQLNTGLYEIKTSPCCSYMKEHQGRMIPEKKKQLPKICLLVVVRAGMTKNCQYKNLLKNTRERAQSVVLSIN